VVNAVRRAGGNPSKTRVLFEGQGGEHGGMRRGEAQECGELAVFVMSEKATPLREGGGNKGGGGGVSGVRDCQKETPRGGRAENRRQTELSAGLTGEPGYCSVCTGRGFGLQRYRKRSCVWETYGN